MMHLAAALGLLWMSMSPEELPVYPGAIHTRIGKRQILDGVTNQMAYFVTAEPAQAVAEYFFRKWKEEGLLTTVDGDFEEEIVVSAFYTREGLQKAVVVRAQGKTTVGFSVVRALWNAKAEPSDPIPGPVEGHLFAHHAEVQDGSQESAQRTTLLSLPLSEARARVAEQLKLAGCRSLPESSVPQHAHQEGLSVEHICSQSRVWTVLIPQDDEMTAVLQTRMADPPGSPTFERDPQREPQRDGSR